MQNAEEYHGKHLPPSVSFDPASADLRVDSKDYEPCTDSTYTDGDTALANLVVLTDSLNHNIDLLMDILPSIEQLHRFHERNPALYSSFTDSCLFLMQAGFGDLYDMNRDRSPPTSVYALGDFAAESSRVLGLHLHSDLPEAGKQNTSRISRTRLTSSSDTARWIL